MTWFDRYRDDSEPSHLRLQTAVRLRWIAVIGQLVAIGFVYFVLGFELPIGFCLTAIAISAWMNVFMRLRFPARYRLSTKLATAMLAYDILQLALLLYLTGGVENPFTFLIVAPVTVSAASLPRSSTILLAAIATIVGIALVAFHLPLPWTAGTIFHLPLIYKAGVIIGVLTGMVFLALYTWRLSQESRQMSAALAATEHILAREQKLHALDGLAAAAAHELGTPLGTIAVVAKELQRELPKESPLSEDIALLRTQALRCRDILQKLTLKPKEIDPMVASLSVRQLLQEAADPYKKDGFNIETIALPGDSAVGAGVIEPEGERRPGVIFGLGNIIENATDFAKTKVVIEARWSENDVIVTISDDGPGFSAEIMDTLGDPYITTRRTGGKGKHGEGRGLGLGVFIAKTLLQRSGAELSYFNRPLPETGAIVSIVWTREDFIGHFDLTPLQTRI